MLYGVRFYIRVKRPNQLNFVIAGARFFSSSRSRDWPTDSPIQWVAETLSPGFESDHSRRSSSEVKNTRIYTSNHSFALMP
jgi:hypothetical protein